MSGTGETYKRSDGKYAFRIKASNGQTVATDGSQGYNKRTDCKAVLINVMAGTYKKSEIYTRTDGRYAFRIKASNGNTVATDGSQGYNSENDAQSTADNLTSGTYNGPITDL